MSQSLRALLEAGLRAQEAGDKARARASFERVLALQPEQPDACQLLGQLDRLEGNPKAAEQWFRRSLTARPAQPQVWNKLGNLLLAEGRLEEALQTFDQALRIDPLHVDALFNRARALHATGQLALADDSLKAAMAQQAQPSASMLQLKGQIEGDAGQVSTALGTLGQALQLAPERAALWHNRAVLLQRSHRPAEALLAHERAAALGLDVADAHYNFGNTLQSLGRLDQAVRAYRTALQRQPNHLLSLLDLARLRWRRGDDEFDAELRQAMDADQDSAAVAAVLGNLLWRAERYADAAAVYREAARRAPGVAGLQDGLGRCLVRLGDWHAGLHAHEQAIKLAPSDAESHSNHAASLLICDRADAALQAAEAACKLAPEHQYAQALRALALRLLGDPRAAALHDTEQLVRVTDLPAPEGWSDIEQFNQALSAALLDLHCDQAAPIDQTLRGGTQTLGDIFEQQHPMIELLRARIAQAVTATIADWSKLGAVGHPFLSRCPQDPAAWRFADSWSSRLRSKGFHIDHVHPHGWLSSAYYVQVPTSVNNSDARQGWIRFGVPDLPLPGLNRQSLVTRMIQPRSGRLVLFPSMMWHGTTAFEQAAERITIAFDVVPR